MASSSRSLSPTSLCPSISSTEGDLDLLGDIEYLLGDLLLDLDLDLRGVLDLRRGLDLLLSLDLGLLVLDLVLALGSGDPDLDLVLGLPDPLLPRRDDGESPLLRGADRDLDLLAGLLDDPILSPQDQGNV